MFLSPDANNTGYRKVQSNTMNANQKKRQYNYLHCKLDHVAPGMALLISVCILMLPMVQLSAEHAQLATKYYVNPINQWHVDPNHMYISHTPLLLSSINNVLSAIVLQNEVVSRLNIGYSLYTLPYFSTCHTTPGLHLNLLSSLGRMMVGVVLVLLLLMSGDIETNPGPVGEFLC